MVRTSVVLLLAIHAGLLGYAATCHSPTFNEPGHLVAGISHWQFGRFELYRVNPPLSHLMAALPIVAVGAATDWNRWSESPGATPVYFIGYDFVAANGERSVWLFTLARWACIPLSLIGGSVCFVWAREWYGTAAGFLALVLWCFCPNILAHGALVTPDLAATSLGVTAAYFFRRWLQNPTWKRATIAGLLLGLVELTKFTWIIMFGLWPALWFFWRLVHPTPSPQARHWIFEGAQLAWIVLFAVYLINLGYGFEGTGTALGDFQFVSAALKGSDAEIPKSGNRFAGTWMGDVPVPVPKNYVLGIDVQKRDFEDPPLPSYLRGEFRNRGWWYYYLYAAAIKVPIGTWVLLLVAGGCAVVEIRRRGATSLLDSAVVLAPAIVVFTLVSSQTGFNYHFRYVLPCFPFVIVWISQIVRTVSTSFWKSIICCVAIVWSVESSLWCYPHSLSYFNELTGGPRNGHAHLIDSNIDWGQDLLYLKQWIDEHPDAKPLYLSYRGYFNPVDIGVLSSDPPRVTLAERSLQNNSQPAPGWYAISVHRLRSCTQGNNNEPFMHRPFQTIKPVATCGYSIYLYHVDRDAVATD